jgi:hypothetical protein
VSSRGKELSSLANAAARAATELRGAFRGLTASCRLFSTDAARTPRSTTLIGRRRPSIPGRRAGATKEKSPARFPLSPDRTIFGPLRPPRSRAPDRAGSAMQRGASRRPCARKVSSSTVPLTSRPSRSPRKRPDTEDLAQGLIIAHSATVNLPSFSPKMRSVRCRPPHRRTLVTSASGVSLSAHKNAPSSSENRSVPRPTKFGQRTLGYPPCATRRPSSPHRFHRTNYSPLVRRSSPVPSYPTSLKPPGRRNVRS